MSALLRGTMLSDVPVLSMYAIEFALRVAQPAKDVASTQERQQNGA
jgi:hypothetical protein